MRYKNIDKGNENFEEIIGNGKKDISRDEITENESESDGKANEAKLERNRAKIMEIYRERERQMEKVVKETKKEIKESGKGIKEAAKGPDGVVDLAYDIRSGLARMQEKSEDKVSDAEVELGKLEYDALEIPENITDEAPDIVEFKKEITRDADELKSETAETIDALKEQREAFVEKFIKESIDGIKENFAKTFRTAQNGKNAEDIIVYKTKKEIELAAKRFIEIGDEAEFGFEASMEVSSYDAEVRGVAVHKNIITGYTIKVGDHEVMIRDYDKPLGASLVGLNERERIKNKIRRGERRDIEKRDIPIA